MDASSSWVGLGYKTMSDLLKKAQSIVDSDPFIGRRRLSLQLGISVDKARRLLDKIHESMDANGPSHGCEKPLNQDSVNGDTRTVVRFGPKIRNVDDLIKSAAVDMTEWFVDRHVVNKWDMGTRLPDGQIATVDLWQVKAWLKRSSYKKEVHDLQAGFLKEIRKAAPRIKRPKKIRVGDEHLLELSIYDLHLGKHSWLPETGQHYDLDTAEELFITAARDLVESAKGYPITRVVFPIGNDFFHSDTDQSTTTRGTPTLDLARWQQSFVRGKALLVKAIEEIARKFHVDVIPIQGNHDYQRVFYLGEVLSAYFRNAPGVTVNNAPTHRKYYRFGKNLIGFTHGRTEKLRELPLIMAAEASSDWGNTTHREFHVGHHHNKTTHVHAASHESSSIRVRVIPSLCAADAWHKMMGYEALRSAEAFVWRRSGGCVANLCFYPES